MITKLMIAVIRFLFRGKLGEELEKLCKKYEEIIDYLFWGGIAFVLSMVLYWLFVDIFGWEPVFSNTLDWVICVLFAYTTNRIFVFKSETTGLKAGLIEFVQFVAARLFTLILEDLIIWGLDTKLGLNSMLVKLIGQVVVIVTNYFLSKLWIFKEKEE